MTGEPLAASVSPLDQSLNKQLFDLLVTNLLMTPWQSFIFVITERANGDPCATKI